MSVAENLQRVRAEIDRAAREAGRDPAAVRLVAVSKLQPLEALRAAVAAGQKELGENYAQELRDKARAVAGARWHFIGPLQRNKVKYVVGVAELVHTVDSPSLIEELARRAATLAVVQRCLIQVNVAREPQKSGCDPDELPQLVDRFAEAPSLSLEGLMCIPPASEAEAARPHFRALAELAARERARSGRPLRELSMGMSADFAVAIAEGATLVRVGTAVFGERPGK
jgi:pyridoxal phosphate enzyme (YggS family)